MPSKKKKYNARFPAGRIKKIMQTDEEVGKVAQAVPIIISRTLELFVHSLLTKTMEITSAKNAKTLSPSHMKQCILSESRFDFLKDLVKSLPDVSGPDEEVPTPPLTPAPINTNTNISNTSTIQHSDIGVQKQQMGLTTEINIEHKNSKDNEGIGIYNSGAVNEMVKNTTISQVPKFQISVPASFQISQPNFYTEVNPMNLSTNTSTVNTNNQPTSNFAHTATLDEDYDT
ncbi:dr1-associated corepressor isoform X1 [Apis laboriosa]|uniref:dr1-associated corepressor isoform X1 n=1 Tax=Apis dorsata TaxID=7462 RepID=UPI0003DF6C92|nr:dr1-associated corepressor isoform X1 [Apis dorsata]XP_043803213.1 dr1-associated corepressor isoform X1 [Apis laboriosa]